MLVFALSTTNVAQLFDLSPRYTLYTRTRLGYMYYKRQMRKAREHYPAGHSTAQPMEFNGMQQSGFYILLSSYSVAYTVCSLVIVGKCCVPSTNTERPC